MKKIKKRIALFLFLGLFLCLFSKKWIFTMYIQCQNDEILRDIREVDESSFLTFKSFIESIENETDWKVMVTSGYRSADEQAVLNRKDARNADAGQSKHNFGKAIDINLYKNKVLWRTSLMKSSTKQDWENSGILKIAQKYKLKWGGQFKSYYDPVHFEIN